jgi:hypothetical protein
MGMRAVLPCVLAVVAGCSSYFGDRSPDARPGPVGDCGGYAPDALDDVCVNGPEWDAPPPSVDVPLTLIKDVVGEGRIAGVAADGANLWTAYWSQDEAGLSHVWLVETTGVGGLELARVTLPAVQEEPSGLAFGDGALWLGLHPWGSNISYIAQYSPAGVALNDKFAFAPIRVRDLAWTPTGLAAVGFTRYVAVLDASTHAEVAEVGSFGCPPHALAYQAATATAPASYWTLEPGAGLALIHADDGAVWGHASPAALLDTARADALFLTTLGGDQLVAVRAGHLLAFQE